MSFFRPFGTCTLIVALAACGFSPLYGGSKNRAINQEFAHIKITLIANREGQIVHNFLLDRLNPSGRSADSRYTLRVSVTRSTQEIGLKFTEEATRAKLILIARYFLTCDTDGKILAEGSVRSVNNYNISDSEFARVVSERDATERAAREVSDEIKTRLGLFFSRRGS